MGNSANIFAPRESPEKSQPRDEGQPSTSVLVDIVYLLGGEVPNETYMVSEAAHDALERLTAAATLLAIAQDLVQHVAHSAIQAGVSTDKVANIAALTHRPLN